MINQYSLSVVFPVYNEEGNIKQTIDDSLSYLENQNIFNEYEIIIVNDGSTDQTASILSKLCNGNNHLKIITNDKNRGYGVALASGIKNTQFSWVLLMDADGQFNINSIVDFVVNFSEHDIITGYRYKRADSHYRNFLGKTYTFVANAMFRLRLKDINCGFKVIRREIFNVNGSTCHSGVFYTDIFLKARKRCCRVKEVPIVHYPRINGKHTGANFGVIAHSMRDLLRLKLKNRDNQILNIFI